jgi:hypothetical protein
MKTLFTLRGMRSQANVVAARVLPEPVGPAHVRKCNTENLHRYSRSNRFHGFRSQTPPVNCGGAFLNESYLWRQDRGSIRYCYLYQRVHRVINICRQIVCAGHLVVSQKTVYHRATGQSVKWTVDLKMAEGFSPFLLMPANAIHSDTRSIRHSLRACSLTAPIPITTAHSIA